MQGRLTGTNTLSIVALTEETVNTADRECKTGFGGAAEVVEALARYPTSSELRAADSRLRILAAAGLASRFASSHID